jgi:hypothetical protein
VGIKTKTGNVSTITGAPADLETLTTGGEGVGNNFSGTTYFDSGVEIGLITTEIIPGVEYGQNGTFVNSLNSHYIIYRQQVTTTTYTEMIVFGLSHFTRITNYTGDGSASTGVAYEVNTLIDIEDGKVFIPLSYDVMQNYNSVVQSKIFYESLTVAVHLLNETKMAWYTSESLWLVARIILFIATWGSSEIWTEALFEIFKEIVINYANQILIGELLLVLVDLIGGEFALALAAIVAVVAIYTGGTEGTSKLFELISAEQLMNSATLLIQAVQQDTYDDFLKLQEEAEAHEAYMTEEEKKLAELEALGKVYTFDFATGITRQPLPDFYETPTSFYNRSVHLTNPGVLSLDTVDVFVKNLLVLPELKEEDVNNSENSNERK